jgi:hypothetical protein
LGRQAFLVEVAAKQGEDDDGERAECGGVQHGERTSTEGDWLGAEGG